MQATESNMKTTLNRTRTNDNYMLIIIMSLSRRECRKTNQNLPISSMRIDAKRHKKGERDPFSERSSVCVCVCMLGGGSYWLRKQLASVDGFVGVDAVYLWRETNR